MMATQSVARGCLVPHPHPTHPSVSSLGLLPTPVIPLLTARWRCELFIYFSGARWRTANGIACSGSRSALRWHLARCWNHSVMSLQTDLGRSDQVHGRNRFTYSYQPCLSNRFCEFTFPFDAGVCWDMSRSLLGGFIYYFTDSNSQT